MGCFGGLKNKKASKSYDLKAFEHF